jgi:acyl transferase domain-containing protein
MARQKVFMYSGQGSQYFHMTRELYDHNPRYRLWLDYCAEIASDLLGKSLLDVVFDPRRSRSDPFDSLVDSNAALVCVEYSLTKLVQEMGHQPDLLLGYSLGEITAAIVAEAVGLEDGLALSIDLGRLVERETPRAGMLAVVASTDFARDRAELFAGCWVTGVNFDGNFVISGRESEIDAVQLALERETVPCQRLPVNYGVHTELIDPVRDKAFRLFEDVAFNLPGIPVVSSVSTDRVDELSAEGLWSAVREPVEFARAAGKVLAAGDATFLDIGPSATLATFVKYLLASGSGSDQVGTVNRFGNDLKSLREFQAHMAGS